MPWEKTFNEDKAIEAAMVLFWEKGYTDTSMANLLEATKLTKGSFYNAFGSKKDLFIKTLLKYDLENRRAVLQELVAMDKPVQAIERFFDSMIEECSQDTDKKGCFLINTSLELNSYDKEIQKIIINALGEVETFFKQMIELGQARGEIAQHINPQDAARSLMGAVAGTRVLGRGIYDKAALKALSKQAINGIKHS